MTLPALIGLAVGLGLILTPSLNARQPKLIWNASPSQPIGLYRLMPGPPHLSDRALVRLPPHLADLAARRGYLAPSAYLLKPVAAVSGDRVCRLGTHISVNGRLVARAAVRDHRGRALPIWLGCHKLRTGELFLLATDANSFDSRYFAAVSAGAVTGRAVLVWSWSRTP